MTIIDNEDLRALRTDENFVHQVYLLLSAADGDGVTSIERAKELAEASHAAGNSGGYDFWSFVQGYASDQLFKE